MARMTTVSGTTACSQLRSIDLEALDRAQDGNRRRDRAVAIEQGRADQADHDHRRAPRFCLARRGLTSASSARMPPSP